MTSRRARERANARPWEHDPEPEDHRHDGDFPERTDMHHITEKKLKAIASAYFDGIKDPIKRHEIEMMYQAFTARLMLETRISGYSNQGVVGGNLEPKG